MFTSGLHAHVIHVDAGERFLAKLAGVTTPNKSGTSSVMSSFAFSPTRPEARQDQLPGRRNPVPGRHREHQSRHSFGRQRSRPTTTWEGCLRIWSSSDRAPPLPFQGNEVREVGLSLGFPSVVRRHPFPGPGLAVRIIGEVTGERLSLLREADAIVTEEIQSAGWYDQLWQCFPVLTPVQTVGVMGDYRDLQQRHRSSGGDK